MKLFIACIRNGRQPTIERLVEHVLDRMGGFCVDGWKLRTPVEVQVDSKGEGHVV